MVRIFFLPYLGNRSKSDPYSYERFCLESQILSFPKVLQIPPETPCICLAKDKVHDTWKLCYFLWVTMFGPTFVIKIIASRGILT